VRVRAVMRQRDRLLGIVLGEGPETDEHRWTQIHRHSELSG
jgi:hypothetical protein